MIKNSNQSKLKISAVIFTKNETANIEECINCLSDFSEIIIVDSQSSDGTIEKAIGLNTKVVNFKWNGKYPKKRQWSLENIDYSNDWILFVDADERISNTFISELRNFFASDTSLYSAGSIPIQYHFLGKKLRYGQRPRKVALLKIGKASFPEVDDLAAFGMGELEGHYQPIIQGKTKKFHQGIDHDDNDPVWTWMQRHINYARWEAHLLANPKTKTKVDRSKGGLATLFHKFPLRPLTFFIYSYFLKFGFLDGKTGFDYAFAKSWYYWLSSVIANEESFNDKL